MLSFLIALFGFIGIISGILSTTISNPKFMINVLENRHYYDSIYSEYCDDIESIAMPAGVAEGVFSAVISKSEFKDTINNIIKSAYSTDNSYSGNVFDKETAYNKFYSSMTDYFTNVKGMTITEEMTDSLDNVASLCASTCGVYATLPFIDTIGKYCTELNKYFKISCIVSAVAVAFLIFILFITKSWRKESPYLLGMALLTDGFMIVLAPFALLISGKVKYVQIEVESLYKFAIGYIEHLLYTLLTVGIVLIIIAVVIAGISYFLNKKIENS
jgi:ABC-type multidrug transport system fused ATPase/permease subunit